MLGVGSHDARSVRGGRVVYYGRRLDLSCPTTRWDLRGAHLWRRPAHIHPSSTRVPQPLFRTTEPAPSPTSAPSRDPGAGREGRGSGCRIRRDVWVDLFVSTTPASSFSERPVRHVHGVRLRRAVAFTDPAEPSPAWAPMRRLDNDGWPDVFHTRSRARPSAVQERRGRVLKTAHAFRGRAARARAPFVGDRNVDLNTTVAGPGRGACRRH